MSESRTAHEAAGQRYEMRLLTTIEEMEQVEQLQQVVWPGSDLSVVPAHLLLTAAHNGGLVAGAEAELRLVGFVFGFPGLEVDAQGLRLKHCSHELGVHPDFRGRGVGFALKCFQRQHVLEQGIDRITWTYDPLLARNAHLNIARLGAVCSTYLRNIYGELRDDLNAGLPSDRFQVDWWLSSERVRSRITGASRERVSLSGRMERGVKLLNPAGPPELPMATPSDRQLLLEIPSDFTALKAEDPGTALRWRLATREAFEVLFSAGYHVVDFLSEPGPLRRTAYLLERLSLSEIAA